MDNSSDTAVVSQVTYMNAFCCPCLVLKEMRRITVSEPSRGRSTCLVAGAYCAVCWPCSPFLALYICLQRWYLRKIYRDDHTDPRLALSSSSVACLFNWPGALLAHHSFLLSKKAEGTLLFDWEHDIANNDGKNSQYSIVDKVVFVIGSNSSGKSTLISKLLLASHGSPSTDNPSSELPGISRFKAGIRATSVQSGGTVHFLEVWEVPEDKVGQEAFRMAIEKRPPKCIILTADITSETAYDSLVYFYEVTSRKLGFRAATVQYVCAVTKFDLYEPRFHFATLNRIKDWSEECLIPVIEHSSIALIGTNELNSAIFIDDSSRLSELPV